MSDNQKPTHYCSYCDRRWVSHDPTCIRCGEIVNYYYEDLGTSTGVLIGAIAATTGFVSGGVIPLVTLIASTTILGNRVGKNIDDLQRPAKDKRRKKRGKRR